MKIGFGYDSHRLVKGRELWLGGVKIEYEKGLLGHSDADVLIHAICDALLGAACLRDIGFHFPYNSEETLDMSSREILQQTVELLSAEGLTVGNIDATIIAEQPKLSPYIDTMRNIIAQDLDIDESNVSIKATTNEGMGFLGKGEGIAAFAVALIT